ncbi:hypothetical protein GCM10007981_03570 [Thermocladium modestius]|uniref:Uncharacterized protein n=1 Tax=Thermocladium modestius TaxID=62609 RepID=A0A830GU52_9CREN|nr:hypothetical protein [Thermocladium modestius]GGP19527.1 hypothetical protein GCM10007981_03570 [Thermocladium modestius]
MKVLSYWKYAAIYLTLLALTWLLFISRYPLASYIIDLITIPLLAVNTVLLASNAGSIRRVTEAYRLLRNVAAPSIFIYLLFNSLSLILASITSHFGNYSFYVSNFMESIALGLIGLFLHRASREAEPLLHESLTNASRFFLLSSLGFLFRSIYGPILYPFLIASLVYLIASPVSVLSRRLGFDYSSVKANVAAMSVVGFGLGLFYVLLTIPKPPIYNGYILIAFLLAASISISLVGYRLYAGGVTTVERVMEEFYEKHKREIEVSSSPEFAKLEAAIREFVVNSRKELLIIYLTRELTKDGLSYGEILTYLGDIIQYNPQVPGRASKKVIEREINNRMAIISSTLRKAMSRKTLNNLVEDSNRDERGGQYK